MLTNPILSPYTYRSSKKRKRDAIYYKQMQLCRKHLQYIFRRENKGKKYADV